MRNQEELEKKVRHIQIHTRKTVMELLAGEYKSAFRGMGIDFEDIREYQFGDDVRTIDWNVTARTGKPHVKLFMEERELSLFFLVDISGSMKFGSGIKNKREITAHIIALLAFSAIHNNDKVAMALFSDQIELFMKPGKTINHVTGMIKNILSIEPKSNKTEIKEALEFIGKISKRPAIVFLFSDFMSDNYQKTLQSISKLHDVICVSINDERELTIPSSGILELIDAETNKSTVIDCNSNMYHRKIAEFAKEQQHKINELCLKINSDFISISSNEDYLSKIIAFLQERKNRGTNNR